jgi:ribosomal protein S6--L-glutamate ligase
MFRMAPPGHVALVCRQDDAHGVARLLACAAARGLQLRPVAPARLAAPGDRGAPALAFTRLISGTPPWMLAPLWRAERLGLPFVNPPSALALAHDKAEALAALDAAGLRTVPTALVVRDADAAAALAALPGERFVLKTVAGAAGRGVVVGLDRAAAARGAAAFADASGPVLVQPVMGGGVDRRLLVVGGRVVAAMERRPDPTGRANLRVGAAATPFEPDAPQAALAVAAAAALRLDVAGVDLLSDERGPLLLEVNASPGLKGVEAVTGRDVAGAILDLLLARLRG